MGYYDVLGITKDAQNEDVAKAFRKMALKFHPELTDQTNAGAFAQVAEAYEVLSNPRLRAKYDEYGSDGLRGGPEEEGYTFTSNPDMVFKEFFGVANPFQVIGSSAGGMKHLFFSSDQGVPRNQPAPPPVKATVKCTLEELFTGASRAVTVPTETLTSTGVAYEQGQTVISFDLEKGLAPGSVLKFHGRGSSMDGNPVKGDVHITVELLDHPLFQWDGDNLLYTQEITLEQALCGFSIEIPTLDKRKISVFVNDVVHPQYTKVIKGEGMPVYQKKGLRGDLVMRFATTGPIVDRKDFMCSFASL